MAREKKGRRADFSGRVFILQKADMAQKSVGEMEQWTVAATAPCAVSGSAGKQHGDKSMYRVLGRAAQERKDGDDEKDDAQPASGGRRG